MMAAPDADAEGVVADVAGLQPAQLATVCAVSAGHAVDGAVDQPVVDPEG